MLIWTRRSKLKTELINKYKINKATELCKARNIIKKAMKRKFVSDGNSEYKNCEESAEKRLREERIWPEIGTTRCNKCYDQASLHQVMAAWLADNNALQWNVLDEKREKIQELTSQITNLATELRMEQEVNQAEDQRRQRTVAFMVRMRNQMHLYGTGQRTMSTATYKALMADWANSIDTHLLRNNILI